MSKVPYLPYAILDENGKVIDGAHGWAIGETAQAAWERAINPAQDWSIQRSKDAGYRSAYKANGWLSCSE